ncbi:tRNA pseudouridine(38-40) synthase TruA [Allopusillimonas ginsengisoli]|uniref:tRNA pseudouridine(38-40) synthase TruA n=1 Tax=Allopusillimonas ginsengisoli TaxID=453575 RepID=UPI0039C4845F
MPRMALSLTYDGSAWHGWQKQPDGRTVQDAFEAGLSRFLDQPVATICAGRTDAGVHALSQVVHLDTTAVRREESWVRGLNTLLPKGIAVQWAQPVSETFHARFSALSRTYVYIVRNARVRTPLMHRRAGWIYHSLDDVRMHDAARRLLGEHDFTSFRSAECQAASPVRTMHAIDIVRRGDYLLFTFRANAFLHHMVRNLMGALLYVGQGKKEPGWMDELLVARDRRLAAPTFAPHGLYLAAVEYPVAFGLPDLGAEEALATHTGFDLRT